MLYDLVHAWSLRVDLGFGEHHGEVDQAKLSGYTTEKDVSWEFECNVWRACELGEISESVVGNLQVEGSIISSVQIKSEHWMWDLGYICGLESVLETRIRGICLVRLFISSDLKLYC